MNECRLDRATGRTGDSDVETVVEHIHDRGRTVRDRQVERALSELDGDLSERERAVVETLGDRLVERLLAVPAAKLRRAAGEGDENRVEHALELFG